MATVCLTNFIILVFVPGQGKCLWSHNGSITAVYIPTASWRHWSQACAGVHVGYPYENCNFPESWSEQRVALENLGSAIFCRSGVPVVFFVGQASPLCFFVGQSVPVVFFVGQDVPVVFL